MFQVESGSRGSEDTPINCSPSVVRTPELHDAPRCCACTQLLVLHTLRYELQPVVAHSEKVEKGSRYTAIESATLVVEYRAKTRFTIASEDVNKKSRGTDSKAHGASHGKSRFFTTRIGFVRMKDVALSRKIIVSET